ncbi:ABC transporter permease [Phytoactinopolyspora alkaliphila]|uniref:ABC transporter permease n=1 Tax=Phytoactinopolyspora alkaliphila TaxID=1783498 RepID=A0A6N9YSG1_9ACTN|nr:ABC transporter permease [Phytoactinopolyspora alkaliphila]NED97983.1 ABC transporter permease [Phytoactinopolyspora alkaliphila]
MRYLLRKLVLYAFIAWAAVTMNFLIPRLMPGDPVTLLVDRVQGQVDPAAVEALREAFGLSDANILRQYIDYLGSLFSGDLGLSITFYPVPVADVVSGAMPWTIGLIGVTTVIGFVIGTGLGVLLAWRRGSWTDGFLPGLTFLNAIPYFWMALVLVMIFAVNLGWFPVSGAHTPGLRPGWNGEFITSVLWHALLPAITIVLASFANWVIGMRNMMVTVLGEDYVTMAEAKGLPERTVMVRYAARNAILPSITGFALSLGTVVGGSMLTEVIFNYPGVGYTLFQAVKNQDFPLMQGMFLYISVAVIIANLIADVVYVFLDPRTRQEA